MRSPRAGAWALLGTLLLVACGGGPRDSLVLVVVDTLRADALGALGAGPEATPRLDRLASRAAVFERAYATAPWTMPSIASILTGQEPHHHGLMGGPRALPGSAETLAERLAAAGYRTGAVTSHVLVTPGYGFQQGFQVFHQRAGSHREVTGGEVTRAAIAMIERLARDGEPFFAFVHYFDPHYAYLDHDEVAFAGRGVGRVRSGTGYRELLAMRDSLSPGEIAGLRALYAEEVRYTDGEIGRLLDALEERGLDGSTWVVVTADHGEELMERGWIGHTTSLRETLLRVPLLLRPPGARPPGDRIATPVSLAGLAPTLLELLGVDAPPGGFDRPSFATLVRGEAPSAPRPPVFAEVDYRRHPEMRTDRRMVLDPPWKLVADRLDGGVALYDLEADPQERHDVSAERPQVVRRLRALLGDASGAARAAEPAPVAPDQREQLRELGYLP